MFVPEKSGSLPCHHSGVFVFSDFFDVWLEEDEIRSNLAIDVTPTTTEDSNPHEATLNRRRSFLKIMVWLDPLENASM